MTSPITPEALEAIIAGCDGVTPGPWESDGVKNDGFTSYEVTDPNGRSVADTYNAGTIEVHEEDGSAWDEQGRKNMAHIARLSPQVVRAAFTELLALRQQSSGAKVVAAKGYPWAKAAENARLIKALPGGADSIAVDRAMFIAACSALAHPVALPTEEADGWRPIETAMKGGAPIWAAFHPAIYPDLEPNRPDLERWNGRQAAISHPGITKDGLDIGWNMAAPVGHGGFPDNWIVGWRPLPAPPAHQEKP